MTYHDRLHPWCIIRLLPKMQRLVVCRFRRRNDAEAHLRTLRQLEPMIECEIIFDVAIEPLESASERKPLQ
ncbi:MAG: hypothetical protein KME15_24435 [Drouetiella hepatica Uher 2000/2452]|uniref:SPOR domain-containing protein n=1 Tax=Drouetiella hepatica Uher 2000/2452 TaxID=904376 RepID=A0A951QFY4_9CYAN|nr:hypothetical protein [Drouetiella hepatica Uher 2000/2452]